MQGCILLEQYEQLNYIVEQMLINARNQGWDALHSWQAKYQQLSEKLMLTDNVSTLDSLSREYNEIIKIHIKNILSYQKQLIQLISNRHTQLGKLIGETVDHQTKIVNYQQIAKLI